MIFLIKLLFCVLIVGELLFVKIESIQQSNTSEIELLNAFELNFHKFIGNYVSNINLIKPNPVFIDRNSSPSSSSFKPLNSSSMKKNDAINSTGINRSTIRSNVSMTSLNKLQNITLTNSLKNNTNSSLINKSKNQTTIEASKATTSKPSILNPNNKPTSTNSDSVVYTPEDCGRSFDEDWIHEGELSKHFLYTSKQKSFMDESNKLIDLNKNQMCSDSSGIREVQNTEKDIKQINNNLENLIGKIDNLNKSHSTNHSSDSSEPWMELKNYSENVNLNVENLIKNFNSSNDSDLEMLKNVLNNREEYQYFGEKRILNGQRANPGQFPWIASLQAWVRYPNRTSPPSWRHLCGGSIINTHWILTAAHCLEFRQFIFLRPKSPRLSVVVGSLSWNNSESVGQRYMVKDWRKYFEPFDALGQYLIFIYDIALIRLEKPIQFSNGVNGVGAVARVCLPKQNDQRINEDLRVAGWGSITQYPKITVPKYLNYVDLPLVPDVECNRRYWPIRSSNRFICAGYLDDARLFGICLGDSGSPLVQKSDGRSVIVGIASGGRGKCGSGQFPATYTRVDIYRDWIKTVTGT